MKQKKSVRVYTTNGEVFSHGGVWDTPVTEGLMCIVRGTSQEDLKLVAMYPVVNVQRVVIE